MLADIESVEHLDEIGIAWAKPDLALHGGVAVGRHHEHPAAAGFVVEGAVGDQRRGCGIAERQLGLQRLAALDVGRLGAEEVEVHLERAVAHLRIDLGDLQLVGLAAPVGRRRLPGLDPAEIEFVDLRDELAVTGAVHLAEPLAAFQRLADMDREGGQLAVDGGAEVQRFQAGARDLEA